MTEPTSKRDAVAAQVAAEARLEAIKGKRAKVDGVTGALNRILEENHFSARLARALGLEDDRT